MRRSPSVERQERARVLGASFKDARKKSTFTAVCLIGYVGAVPKHFGDNQGVWPVRVVTTVRPHYEASRLDYASPVHKVRVLDLVWTETKDHAKRLKATLDVLLLGTGASNKVLRHGWRDIETEPEIVWPILLSEALRTLAGKREKVEVFDTAAVERKLYAKAGKRR